jgi:hypothetical protein
MISNLKKLFILLTITSTSLANPLESAKVVTPCTSWHTVDHDTLLALKPESQNLQLGPEGFYLLTPEACYVAKATDVGFAEAHPAEFKAWESISGVRTTITSGRDVESAGLVRRDPGCGQVCISNCQAPCTTCKWDHWVQVFGLSGYDVYICR